MKLFVTMLCCLTVSLAFADDKKIKMNFVNEQLTTIIGLYSKASGQKFTIDPTVRGTITLLNPEDVTLEESFNQISEALALNGFAIVKHGDMMTIRNARSAQRDGIEVSTTLPSAKPQRMATWIVNLKHVDVWSIRSQIGRLLSSSYGEIEAVENTNQLIITDFTSSINRIAEMIKNIDQAPEAGVMKIVEKAKKERLERNKHKEKIEKKVELKMENKAEPKAETTK